MEEVVGAGTEGEEVAEGSLPVDLCLAGAEEPAEVTMRGLVHRLVAGRLSGEVVEAAGQQERRHLLGAGASEEEVAAVVPLTINNFELQRMNCKVWLL